MMRRVSVVASVLLCVCAVAILQGLEPQDRAQKRSATNSSAPLFRAESLPGQPTIYQTTTTQEERAKPAYPERWFTKENAPDWLMVFITLGGFYFAWRQIRDAKEAVLLTERADVFVEQVGFVTQGPLTGSSILQITLKNYGRTRADNLRIDIRQGMADSTNLQPGEPPITVLGAGAEVKPRYPPLVECLTKDGFAAVIAGTHEFDVRGTVTYDDVFGHPHTLRIRAVYSRKHHSFLIEENSGN